MVDFPSDRYSLVGEEFQKPYFVSLINQLKEHKTNGEIIYPLGSDIFRAFRSTPVEQMKVVILGQDPYHGAGQAHGLSFSVPGGVVQPPSLKNIFKEICAEFGGTAPVSGDLSFRAEQGVLLLNTILTVKAGNPASHHGLGREQFTDTVIQKIADYKPGLVFLLRGNFARQKKLLIDTTKHLVLEAPHPSPFSVHTGFFGCNHFILANKRLEQQQQQPIKRIIA